MNPLLLGVLFKLCLGSEVKVVVAVVVDGRLRAVSLTGRVLKYIPIKVYKRRRAPAEDRCGKEGRKTNDS